MSVRISPYRLSDGTRKYRLIEADGGDGTVLADGFASVSEAHTFLKAARSLSLPRKEPRFDVYAYVGDRQVGMGENLTVADASVFVVEHLPFLEVGSKLSFTVEKMEAA